MSCHWHDSNDRLDSARRLVESLPDPAVTSRYLALPHSYVCERLAEADAEIALNLRDNQALRERVRSVGASLIARDLRIEELERELEKPQRRDLWEIALFCVTAPMALWLFLQGWARLVLWLAR